MTIRLCISFCFAALAAMAQPSPDYSQFEVAAVRPSPPKPNLPPGAIPAPTVEGGPGSTSPERISYNNHSSWALVMRAYDIPLGEQLVFPQALRSGIYDISATLPPGASKEQERTMLQNFLATRFHLQLHREMRNLPVYAMTVGKNGLKLKESSPAVSQGPVSPGTVTGGTDKEGFLVLPANYVGIMAAMPANGRIRLIGQKQTLAQLGSAVQGPRLGHPVVDQTGLTGLYDFKLEMEWIGRPGAPATDQLDAPPTVFEALDKIGLKLELKQLPYEVLVVDQIDKTPTDN